VVPFRDVRLRRASLIDGLSLRVQAKKKPLQKLKAADLGADLAPRLESVNVAAPPARQGGAKVSRNLLTAPFHNFLCKFHILTPLNLPGGIC
jgi:electron transfer flavoprotein alpha/beta subunit